MIFHVGPHTYRLRVTAGALIHGGAECLGGTIQTPREILISADCPAGDRLRVLLRELCRAWSFEVGAPHGDDWMDLAATVALAAMKDLNTQGGALALLALRPGERTDHSTVKIGLSTNRYCPCCQETVAGGSVHWGPGEVPGVVDLAIFCPFCGDTWRWREAQAAGGMPTGIVLGTPVKERGDTTRAALALR